VLAVVGVTSADGTFSSAGAAPAALSCGALVTADLTLAANLVDCPGDGLVVGASGITVDLRDHTIDGDDDGGLGGGAGIRIQGPNGGVTVRNGTIAGFSEGIQIEQGSTANRLTGLAVVGNVRGISLSNAGRNIVERSTVSDSDLDGIRVDGAASVGNEVSRNVIVGNVFGISVSNGATDNTVKRNEVRDGTFGISVFAGADRTTVSRNDVVGNSGVGVQVDSFADDAVLSRNSVTGNGVGIGVGVDVFRTLLERNQVTGNSSTGVRIEGRSGQIERNNVVGNGSYGILLTASSAANTLTRNNVTNNTFGNIADQGIANTVG
jgi:parallel beta-helix repeat protein